MFSEPASEQTAALVAQDTALGQWDGQKSAKHIHSAGTGTTVVPVLRGEKLSLHLLHYLGDLRC